MEKRLISALAISVLIILAFQYMTVKPPPPPVTPQQAEQIAAQQFKAVEPGLAPAPADNIPERDLLVETDRYVITFSDVGGAIKSIRLKDFKAQAGGEPLELVAIRNQSDYLMSIDAIGAAANTALATYTLSREPGAIIYSLRTSGWDITKRYLLHNSKQGIELQINIKNITGAARDFNYRIIGGAGVTDHSEEARRFIEATANIDGKVVGYKRSKTARTINPGVVKWSALKNKYFSIILKPMVASKERFYSENTDGQIVTGVGVDMTSVQPGASIENRYILYVGPSHIPELQKFGYGFEETVNYGFFGGISKALIAIMRFFYSLVHSWGIAVILLSIFLNIILFPLTMKSFQSMQKMQALHPQMEKLKKLHKDNPQKLNKEIMELYKKYKINPLGGCLPMLLQMPIFIALYQALMKSIELRNTSFLWIQDLSSPDAVKLPFTLPLIGNSINILPLVMVVGMVLQQKISSKTMGGAVTEEQKQQQKMMLILMPIMFGFIFYSMPSGLVLYWIVNTFMTIVEQAAVMKNTVIEA